MISTIINTAISTIIGTIIGILVNKLKNNKEKIKRLKERDDLQNEALMTLLQSNLTNTYFAYSESKKIPDYVYQNWLTQFRVYEKLGGNDFVHVIAKKISTFEIIHETN